MEGRAEELSKGKETQPVAPLGASPPAEAQDLPSKRRLGSPDEAQVSAQVKQQNVPPSQGDTKEGCLLLPWLLQTECLAWGAGDSSCSRAYRLNAAGKLNCCSAMEPKPGFIPNRGKK